MEPRPLRRRIINWADAEESGDDDDVNEMDEVPYIDDLPAAAGGPAPENPDVDYPVAIPNQDDGMAEGALDPSITRFIEGDETDLSRSSKAWILSIALRQVELDYGQPQDPASAALRDAQSVKAVVATQELHDLATDALGVMPDLLLIILGLDTTAKVRSQIQQVKGLCTFIVTQGWVDSTGLGQAYLAMTSGNPIPLTIDASDLADMIQGTRLTLESVLNFFRANQEYFPEEQALAAREAIGVIDILIDNFRNISDEAANIATAYTDFIGIEANEDYQTASFIAAMRSTLVMMGPPAAITAELVALDFMEADVIGRINVFREGYAGRLPLGSISQGMVRVLKGAATPSDELKLLQQVSTLRDGNIGGVIPLNTNGKISTAQVSRMHDGILGMVDIQKVAKEVEFLNNLVKANISPQRWVAIFRIPLTGMGSALIDFWRVSREDYAAVGRGIGGESFPPPMTFRQLYLAFVEDPLIDYTVMAAFSAERLERVAYAPAEGAPAIGGAANPGAAPKAPRARRPPAPVVP